MVRLKELNDSIKEAMYYMALDSGCSRSMINSRRVPAEPDDSVFLFGKVSGGSGVQKYEGIVKGDSAIGDGSLWHFLVTKRTVPNGSL